LRETLIGMVDRHEGRAGAHHSNGGGRADPSSWPDIPPCGHQLSALRSRQVDTARTARSQYGVVPVPRISREELKQRLDSGAPIVVVDARLKYPYEHSTVKLPGAVRVVADAPLPALPRDR